MAVEGDSNDVKAIERVLLRLDDTLLPSDSQCNIRLDVNQVGSWIVKFRNRGVIYNNCELIFTVSDVQAIVSFKSLSIFWSIVNGGGSLDESVSKGLVSRTGDENAIDLFTRKLLRTGDTHSAIISPNRLTKVSNDSSMQPLKAGWMLKKRDLFSGWRCRFFVVYFGRVEYYIDQHDLHPRAIVALFGADISQPKKVTINGVGDHWSIVVQPKNREKPFKLSSELTGDDGLVEATTWAQVFDVASRAQYDGTSAMSQSSPTSSSDAAAMLTLASASSRGSKKRRETGGTASEVGSSSRSANSSSSSSGKDGVGGSAFAEGGDSSEGTKAAYGGANVYLSTADLLRGFSQSLSNLSPITGLSSAVAILVAGWLAKGLAGAAFSVLIIAVLVGIILIPAVGDGNRKQSSETRLRVDTGDSDD